MISAFIEGLLLGFGASVPLGPINLLIMNEALKSYKKALAIGFGAMSADLTYLILIFYGVTNYLQDRFFLNFLSLVGGLFLTYFAFMIFQGRNRDITKTKSTKTLSLFSTYLKGYILTLLNPYTILFWLSVTTYSTTTDSLGATIFGMVVALLLWIVIMPYVVYSKRALISTQVASIIALVSSIIIALFGFSLLYGFVSKVLV